MCLKKEANTDFLYCSCIHGMLCYLPAASHSHMRCRSATYVTAGVGAQSKHRHVPSQPGIPKSNPGCNPTQAPQTKPHDCQLSLVALPATALTSIFHHLDSVDGFNLAQTCHACAAEFAHQQADFTQIVWEELAPTVTRDPPRGDCEGYGTASNPVSLHVKQAKNPDSTLRRLYAVSQQPYCVDVVNELWRQAWPQAL